MSSPENPNPEQDTFAPNLEGADIPPWFDENPTTTFDAPPTPTEVTDPTEIMTGPVQSAEIQESHLSARGLWRRIARRQLSNAETRLQNSEGDAESYKNPAELGLESISKMPEYDPMLKFVKTHRTKRGGFGEPNPEWNPDTSLSPRTSLQEQAALRNNLRVDAINELGQNQAKYLSLYGNILFDENAVEERIRNGRFTRGQAKSLRKASRVVREAQISHERIHGRLERSAKGEDIPGRYTAKKIEDEREHAEWLRKHVEALDARAQGRSEQRQQFGRRVRQARETIGSNPRVRRLKNKLFPSDDEE